MREDSVATEQSGLKMLETDTGRRRSDARGGEAGKGRPAARAGRENTGAVAPRRRAGSSL